MITSSYNINQMNLFSDHQDLPILMDNGFPLLMCPVPPHVQLLMDYWWCIDCQANVQQNSPEVSSSLDNNIKKSKKFKTKQTLLNKYGFQIKATNLLKSLQELKGDEFTYLIEPHKKPEPKNGVPSKTRSSFIGVTKNGWNWQALIAINKRKTYIGTYATEQEAAIAFDFHWILLHQFAAKTNLRYTRQNLIDMISNYVENDNVFSPRSFVF
jgi:hypothetical protein